MVDSVNSSLCSAKFLKSECPDAALSWLPVKMYQRSLGVLTQPKSREQEEGGAAVSSDATPVAKRRRTTSQGEMDTCLELLKGASSGRREYFVSIISKAVLVYCLS